MLAATAVIQLNPLDNTVVCRRPIKAGEIIIVNGEPIEITEDVAVGHKIATREIRNGEAVVKYGVRVGSATAEIQPGTHVHLHNLTSDYIAGHTRDRQISTRSGQE